MTDQTRLYLITPPEIVDPANFAAQFERALDAGSIACIQLRLKSKTGEAPSKDIIMRAGEILLPIARARDVAFLVNDRPDLARALSADGVHVGQSDMDCAEARTMLGPDATIGVTCHNSRHLALLAGEAGADYVAFGAFFPTETKEAPTRADPEIIEWWRFATDLPCVAIGGVTAEYCGPLVRAGADFLAVSSAVWSHPDGAAAGVKALEAAIAEHLDAAGENRAW